MMNVTLHPTPRWRDILVEQIRLVALSLRREALIIAAVLAVATFIIAVEIVQGGPGFDADDPFPIAFVAALFPFAVWRGERRYGAAFLWTLPVERRRLALAKVLAGGVYLAALVAAFIAWLTALVLFAGQSPAEHIARIPIAATIITYLFGSAFVLGLRHPLRWLLGAGAFVFVMGLLSELFGSGQSEFDRWLESNGWMTAIHKACAAWFSLPDTAEWAITTIFWLTAGVAALWAALSRHKETR